MKIRCKTVFDCSCTGVTGHYRSSQLPFIDRNRQSVSTQAEWTRSRNQQRNYETLLQIFGLKTQPLDITAPKKIDHVWQFDFTIETTAVFASQNSQDLLFGLKQDCMGVPMIADVSDSTLKLELLEPNKNIWFEILNIETEN
jgi:hypothetical protein